MRVSATGSIARGLRAGGRLWLADRVLAGGILVAQPAEPGQQLDDELVDFDANDDATGA
jgi:hypothetical protein